MTKKINLLQHIDAFGLWLTKRVLSNRWLFLFLTIAVLAATAPGLGKLTFSSEYRDYFGPENPQLIAFDNIEREYATLDNFLIVVQPGDKDVFSQASYPMVQRATELAWSLPGVNRVNSLSNYQHTRADEDSLVVEDLLEPGIAFTTEQLAEKRVAALAEPTLRGYLISDDASTTGIDARATLTEDPEQNLVAAMIAVRALIEQLREEYPDATFALSGTSPLSNAFVEAASIDSATLIPLMYVALTIAMLIIYRSISATVITVGVVLGSTIFALGIAGYLGVQLTSLSVSAPIIIMTLAVADSVHILMSTLMLMRRGKDKRTALIESMRINFVAVAITSVTTMIGFASLNFSDTPPMHDLGNITVFGIFGAWALSVTFIPAMVALLPFKVRVVRDNSGRKSFVDYMLSLSHFTQRHDKKILYILLPVCLVLTSFIPQVEIDDQFLKIFNYRVEYRSDADFVLENLTGAYRVDFDVSSGVEEGITDPEYLQNLEAFSEWLRTQPGVRSVYSFTDIMKRLNKSMHGDDQSMYRLPEAQELAAQYLLMFELSLPYGQDLNERIKFDKSASLVSVVLDDLSAADMRAFAKRAGDWLTHNALPAMQSEGAGPTLMFCYLTKRNLDSMISGTFFAVGLITAVMALALGSIRMGLLSLVPNLLPIVVTLGIWTIVVGVAGMATSIIGVASLGVVVDNTTHFLIKFVRARKESLKSIVEAIDYAFEMVGAALVANAGILIFGFSLLAFSTFRPNFEMGVLMAGVISAALIIDLLLLPALLLLGRKSSSS